MTTTRSSILPPPGQVVITDPDVMTNHPLPKLKYGYCDRPLTWSDATEIIHVEQDLAKLTRSESQQMAYQIFQHHMKQQYVSSTDYLLISKFGFDAVAVSVGDRDDDDKQQRQNPLQNNTVESSTMLSRNSTRERWKAKPSLDEVRKIQSIQPQSILIENDFPYYFTDDIKHYVLWKINTNDNKGNTNNDGSIISEQEIDDALEQLKTKLKAVSTLHWKNPSWLQSLPDVDHVHILCRILSLSSSSSLPSPPS